MGILFKNIKDISVLKSLFPKECEITWAVDKDIYGDGKQAGTAYYIYDETYLLIPRHSKHIVKTIAGDRERECITWDVHVTIHIPSNNRMEPDDYEDKELLLDASFEDAVIAINTDMFRCEIMNCMENFDYENTRMEEMINRNPMYT